MTEPVTPTRPTEKVERAFVRFMAAVVAFGLALIAVMIVGGVVLGTVLGDVRDLSKTNCRGLAILEAATGPAAQEAANAQTGRAVGGIIAGINAHTDAVHGITTTTRTTALATTTTTYVFRPDLRRCK